MRFWFRYTLSFWIWNYTRGAYLRRKRERENREGLARQQPWIAERIAAFNKPRAKKLDYRDRRGGVFSVGVAAEARFVQQIIAERAHQERERNG